MPTTVPLPFYARLAFVLQEAQQDALLSFERVMQSALARDWAADKGRLFGLMAPATAGADQGAGPLGGLSFGSLTTLPPAGESPAHARPHSLGLCNQCSLPKRATAPGQHVLKIHCHRSCSRLTSRLSCSTVLCAWRRLLLVAPQMEPCLDLIYWPCVEENSADCLLGAVVTCRHCVHGRWQGLRHGAGVCAGGACIGMYT